MVTLWTPCREWASDCEEKCNTPYRRENWDLKITKNSTNEASMLLKTRDAFRKRTQNELKTSAQVREIESKLELSDSAHVRQGELDREGCGRVRNCPNGRNLEDRAEIRK